MELYSKRMKAAKNPPTAYRYDLPIEFRGQVIHILIDSIGYTDEPLVTRPADFYEDDIRRTQLIHGNYHLILKEFCDEYGLFGLPGIAPGAGPCEAFTQFFQIAEADQALDLIEIAFHQLPSSIERLEIIGMYRSPIQISEATEKLNMRFKEHAIGYRLEQGKIIRIDSEFLHAEAVEPALQLMYTQGYEGAFQEFMLAQKHYRQGPEHYDDCLTNCGKSLESVLKTICVKRSWAFDRNDTASKLLGIIFSYKLIPDYLQSHFGGLRATIEGGVPTIRNREGGHGSGEKPNDVPEYLAAYQLHLTASAIVFLIRANENFDKCKP
jgi:AbiJ N-terminal domain 4